MGEEAQRHEGKNSKPPVGHSHLACKACGYAVLYKDSVITFFASMRKLRCPNCLNENQAMFHKMKFAQQMPESVSVLKQGTNFKPVEMNKENKMHKLFRG